MTEARAKALLFLALAEDDEGQSQSEGRDSRGRKREEESVRASHSPRIGLDRNYPGTALPEFQSNPIRQSKSKARDLPGDTASPPSFLPLLSTQSLTVSALKDKYLDWVKRHRSDRLHEESDRHLSRFCQSFGKMESMAITGDHLEQFTDDLQTQGQSRLYAKKHATSIRTMFSRGRKAGWLPPTFQPFSAVEGIRIDLKPLLESDIPTPDEVAKLKSVAKGIMADIFAIYHATGMRTHELIEARAGDFQPQSRTIVLGRHKRSKTMKSPTPRTITLNSTAYEILRRRCEGRDSNSHIIVNRNGKPYDSRTLANRFQSLRDKAGVRAEITIYSFRHLWISEALMAGLDALLVARMAGTSVAMIERVYGHFRSQSLHDAQSKLDAMRDCSISNNS